MSESGEGKEGYNQLGQKNVDKSPTGYDRGPGSGVVFGPDYSVGSQRRFAEARNPKLAEPATASPEDQIDPDADRWLEEARKNLNSKKKDK